MEVSIFTVTFQDKHYVFVGSVTTAAMDMIRMEIVQNVPREKLGAMKQQYIKKVTVYI
jgi:hypothetical protein